MVPSLDISPILILFKDLCSALQAVTLSLSTCAGERAGTSALILVPRGTAQCLPCNRRAAGLQRFGYKYTNVDPGWLEFQRQRLSGHDKHAIPGFGSDPF